MKYALTGTEQKEKKIWCEHYAFIWEGCNFSASLSV